MAKKKRKIRYPTPWKEVSRDLRGIEMTQGHGNNVCIRPKYNVLYKQRYGSRPDDIRHERRDEYGTSLNEVLRCLKISDRHDAILAMVKGGLTIIEGLYWRYEWWKKKSDKKAILRERLRWKRIAAQEKAERQRERERRKKERQKKILKRLKELEKKKQDQLKKQENLKKIEEAKLQKEQEYLDRVKPDFTRVLEA